jgi:hypothetical protein
MLLTVAAARTDYFSPQRDRTNFRSNSGSKTTPDAASRRAVQRLLTPPPRLPVSSSIVSSNSATARGFSPRNNVGPSGRSPAHQQHSPAASSHCLAPPDHHQRYDPTPALTSEGMQVGFVLYFMCRSCSDLADLL